MSHQLPPLPKSGGSTADLKEGVFTGKDMRAYAELAIASVKREPLIPALIREIASPLYSPKGFDEVAFVRAIEQAHGITAQPPVHNHILDVTEMVANSSNNSSGSQWLPIESVPDGQIVLFCNMDASVELRNAFFVDWMFNGESCSTKVPRKATHWMPLPPPPVTATTSSREEADG